MSVFLQFWQYYQTMLFNILICRSAVLLKDNWSFWSITRNLQEILLYKKFWSYVLDCGFGYWLLLSSSLSYEEGHPSHSETDLLQRQTLAASHQLPGYTSTSQPTGKNYPVHYSTNLGTFSDSKGQSVLLGWVMNLYKI